MSHRQRTFRVFISSTFSDLKAERDALQAEVFPRLRALCAEHGFRFHAIDLRWGVRDEASLDQRTMAICLDEIRRCQRMTPRPNFVLLLGDRHGWMPLPAEIPEPEFLAVREQIPAGPDRDLLDDWYRRDANALPPVYYLRPRTGEYQDRDRWGDVESRLQPLLAAGAAHANLATVDNCKYVQSATEQEIMLGALGVADAGEHVFAFMRRIRGLPVSAGGIAASAQFRDLRNGRPDRRAAGALRRLRRALRGRLGSHVRRYVAGWTGSDITTDHVQRLCDDVHRSLSSAILAQIERFNQTDALDDEVAAHLAFGRDRAAHFQGRTAEIKRISEYLGGSTRSPMVVIGASGAGKSALMARAAEVAEQSGAVVVRRFIGVSPESARPRSLLEGLCREVARRYGLSDGPLPADRHELAHHLCCMKSATAAVPLVLVIDSLDQFADVDLRAGWPAMIDWIPRELPPHVRMVVSVLRPEHAAGDSAYRALFRRLGSPPTVELQPMSPLDGRALLESWLAKAGRMLQPTQLQTVLDAFAVHGLPLHLRLAFEECRRWRSDFSPPPVPDNMPAIIAGMFARLSADHGGLLIDRALGYLAGSRSGLSEDELLDVLAIDAPFMDDFVAKAHHDLPTDPRGRRLPVVVWSRLFADLEPFLAHRISDGVALMVFYHRQLEEAARRQFLAGDRGVERAARLAAYFDRQPDWLARHLPNRRKSWEQAYQLTQAADTDRLRSLLLDVGRFEAKCAAGLFFDAIADCDRALSVEPSPGIGAARRAMELAQPAIVARVELAAQAYWNALAWTDVADAADAVTRGRSLLRARPYAILAESPTPGGRASSGGVTIDHRLAAAAYAVSPSGQAIAVLAHGAEGLCRVFDAGSGEQIDERRLGEAATAIAFIDDHALAAVTISGRVVVDGATMHTDAMPRQTSIAFHNGMGLVGVRSDGTLVAWSTIAAGCDVLAANVGSLSSLRVDHDGRTIAAVGGAQAHVLRRTSNTTWENVQLPPLGPPAMDCDVGPNGRMVAVLSRDRRLRVLELTESGPARLCAEVAYEASPAGVRGPPEWCAVVAPDTVVFSTFDGVIGALDWTTGALRRLPDYRTKQGEGLLLCVRSAGSDRLLLGADRWARLVSASPTGPAAHDKAHQAAVTGIAIDAAGAVASLSRVGQSLVWHKVPGLPMVAVQSHRKPTAVAAIAGEDAVLMGNASGHLWRQPRAGSPAEITHAFPDAVVAIPAVAGRFAAAGGSGRLVMIDDHAEVQALLALPRPQREQASILPAGEVGLLWSITRDENVPGTPPGTTSTVVTLWTHDHSERIAWVDPRRYESAAVSGDGRRLFLAGRWQSLLLVWNGRELVVEAKSLTPVTGSAFVAGDTLLITALADEPWLELWRLTADFAVVSAVRLPVHATALAAADDLVVAGLASGELAAYRIHVSSTLLPEPLCESTIEVPPTSRAP